MSRRIWIVLVLATVSMAGEVRAQGIINPSAGPINSSMAGASTAAPVDFGSTYWNPANLSGLERPEFLLGSALIIPSTHLTSIFPQGSVNGTFPPQNRYGVSRSDSGVVPNLATGTAFKLNDESPWTFGIGVFGFAGGNVNYAGSNTTPLLTPRNLPKTFGFGPIWGNMSLLTITPSASMQVTDQLSIGGGPVIGSTTLGMSPAFFAPGPKDANGISTFPAATNARTFWGAGFQLGLLYQANETWNFGFSYKSPIWQERWAYNSETPNLTQRRIGIQAQIPAIYSWGVAYKGIDRALIDVDFRYLDYANAPLFGQSVANGGLGWNGVFALAVGGQYAVTDKLTLRAGYLFNTNPIPAPNTLFNLQLPAITTNTMSLGSSYKVTDDITFSLAWVHGFRNSLQGTVEQLPGASTKFDVQTDSIIAGINIQFGGKSKAQKAAEAAETDSE